jgi:hypothetical protein
VTPVVFKTEHQVGPTKFVPGQFTYLPDAEAQKLVEQGVVEIRRPLGPTETKGVRS